MANISDFKAQLIGGGARPNQFSVELTFPAYVVGGPAVGLQSQFLCKAAQLPASNIENMPIQYRGRAVNFAGERVFQPNLGMDLRSLIFEPLTEDITIQIENNIVDVFSRWLPFVDLRNINVNRKDDLNQVNINIDFNIRRAPNNLESVQVAFEGVGAGSSTSNGAY